MGRPFKSELVVEEKISEATLKAYCIGFDENKFRLQPLVDVIRSVIPEFALGYYCGQDIPLTDIIARLKEAAETVYDTDKYKRRGEFGELILHFLLRDFHNTIPLISKIFFKDAVNVNVHGFDGVQITIENDEKKLWLGESKLYKDGLKGIKELVKDLKNHLKADYLRSEFTFLSRRLPNNIPEIEHWRQLMDKHQKLDTIFSSIVIPMVCTYTSPIYDGRYTCICDDFTNEFETECRKLLKEFEDRKIDTDVEILLLLLPVESKDNLNTELHKRLKSMQAI
jgi:hypothetical protein